MAKEYNIDDILSEVKKRRTENEEQLKQPEQTTQAEDTQNEAAEEVPEETVEEAEETPEQDGEETVDAAEDAPANEAEQAPAPQEETVVPAEEQGAINIFDYADSYGITTEAEYEEVPQEELGRTKKSKGKIIAIILAVVLLVVIVAGVIIGNNILNSITTDTPEATTESQWAGMDELTENFITIEETDASQIASLKDMIKTWYYNGVPASSSQVLNVLLIGEDGWESEILEDGGARADAAILASINTQTQQITLTSVLRDTYAYWENVEGDKSTGTFGKINGVMAESGINGYINAVESLYKVKVDNYVIVNFESFEAIIDALGGVTIELTAAEIKHLNNNPIYYGEVNIEKTFEGNSGPVRLNGYEALQYCRIRRLDSDTKRADRQKNCLMAIFDELKVAGTTTQLQAATSLLPYVKTGFSKNEILQIAKYAITDGWLSYNFQTYTVPNSRINESGAGGTYYGAWCWKTDFPQDAYNLQMLIYGKSNIVLAKTRVDVIKCAEYGFYSEGDKPVSATVKNQHYGEVTTLPTTTQKNESTHSTQPN